MTTWPRVTAFSNAIMNLDTVFWFLNSLWKPEGSPAAWQNQPGRITLAYQYKTSMIMTFCSTTVTIQSEVKLLHQEFTTMQKYEFSIMRNNTPNTHQHDSSDNIWTSEIVLCFGEDFSGAQKVWICSYIVPNTELQSRVCVMDTWLMPGWWPTCSMSGHTGVHVCICNQSINQLSIAPISPMKPGSVARQPNQCLTAKSRKQFRNINRPWEMTVSMGERPSQRYVSSDIS